MIAAGRTTKHSTSPRGARGSRAAFTLVELLVVMAICGIIVVSLSVFTRTTLGTAELLQNQNLASQTCRTALARFGREAALAKVVSALEEYRIAFTCTDITGDGVDDDVEYRWDRETQVLTRILNGAGETFAENVTLFLLEYQYESEDEVTIAAPGETLGMSLGYFHGADPSKYDDEDLEDVEVDVDSHTNSIRQFFNNRVEVPAVTSVTVRARTKILPSGTDVYLYLHDPSHTRLAYGYLNRGQLTTTFQDVTVPVTWTDPTRYMEPDKQYHWHIQPRHTWRYAGTILYQEIKDGPGLGDGLMFDYPGHYFYDMASMYFTTRGNLPITTPTHSSVPISILKTIKATMVVNERGELVERSRTCKVLNQ